METRVAQSTLLGIVLLASMGARHQSANFLVETPDPKLAAQIAQAAEKYRRDLAIEWLGRSMADWSRPCLLTVAVGKHLSPDGATTFVYDRGSVFVWRMTIRGSSERVLNSVLPHEVTHAIFASHFRRPLPRWADEGGAVSVEQASVKSGHRESLLEVLRTGRGIALSQMFAMNDYPRDVIPLYTQGYSVAEFLIERGGRRKYVELLEDGLQSGQWEAAVYRHYGIPNLDALQGAWSTWVANGFPK